MERGLPPIPDNRDNTAGTEVDARRGRAPLPRSFTESDVAVATFLARYSGPTRKTYTAALRRFQDWYGPDILHASRADIELFSHHLQDDEGLKRSTVAGYLVVLSSFFKVALADARITVDPTLMVRRPRVYYDPARLTGLTRHDLEKLLLTADQRSPQHAALVILLGGLGLRASEAAAVQIEDFAGYDRGHRVLRLVGKGGKPATIPIPPLIARILDRAAGDRTEGHLVRTRTGCALTRHDVYRWLRTLGKQAGLGHIHPHQLRHAMASIALEAGASLREVQEAGRWADIRMVEHYDRNRLSLDRHAAYRVSAHLSGIANRIAA